MTQQPPNSATPEDIEAALQHLRSSVGAPPSASLVDEHPDRRRRRPDGWGRFLALLLLAGLAGAAAVLFIPALGQRQGGIAPQVSARLAAVESRVDRLASETARDDGRKGAGEIAARLDALAVRIDALEQGPKASGAPSPDRLAALEGQIAAIKSQIAALESRVGRAAPVSPSLPGDPPVAETGPSADPNGVSNELAALDRRLSAIEDSLPTPEVFAAMDRRLTDLEAADPNTAQRNAALALIVARLGQAVAEGRPFALELAALQEAAPDLIDAAALQPYAERGLPPVSVLSARLETLNRDIRAAADDDRGGDWLDRLWRGIAGLVVVRADGEAAGNEPEDRLDRAIWRARAGDLRAAAAEIGLLTGHAAEAASVWLGDAKARLAVEDALGAASARILQDLARTGP